MPMMKCRECGQEMSNRALACPHCGVILQGHPVDLIKCVIRLAVYIFCGLFGLLAILIIVALVGW